MCVYIYIREREREKKQLTRSINILLSNQEALNLAKKSFGKLSGRYTDTFQSKS